ncbi:hypothetical protein FLWE109334_09180 [Flavobacterium weaverense]|uniref:Uncharacterized protein n=1 Tax=Flavobacterium weaverense TaxID=271156 RepID=A0A3L9ZV30_9FLAO|nr:hypothetical protein BC961_2388 [Flavobacterium weaverense]
MPKLNLFNLKKDISFMVLHILLEIIFDTLGKTHNLPLF